MRAHALIVSTLSLAALVVACDRKQADAGKSAAADSATADACTAGVTPIVTPGGVGPVKLGQTLADVARRCAVHDTTFLGIEGMRETGGVVTLDGHQVLALTTGSKDGSITRIVVTDSAFRTERGIGIGNRVGDLRSVYGKLCAAIGEGNVVVTAGPIAGISFQTSADYGRLARHRPPIEHDPGAVPDSAHLTRFWVYDGESTCGGS